MLFVGIIIQVNNSMLKVSRIVVAIVIVRNLVLIFSLFVFCKHCRGDKGIFEATGHKFMSKNTFSIHY